MNHELLGLLRAYMEGSDDSARLALADWCEENGDPDLSRTLRDGIPLVSVRLSCDDSDEERRRAKINMTAGMKDKAYSLREWNVAANAMDKWVWGDELVFVGMSLDEVIEEADDWFADDEEDGED